MNSCRYCDTSGNSDPNYELEFGPNQLNPNKTLMKNVNQYLNQIRSMYTDFGQSVENGFQVDKTSENVFQLAGRSTGKAIPLSDMHVFLQLSDALPDVNAIFVIGNAFGFSTIYLALLWQNALVDVINSESEGEHSGEGSQLTRDIAKRHGLNIQVTKGSSPGDVPAAMRALRYDLVFIDGYHSNDQIIKDFEAVEPFLSERCVVMFHDVKMCNLQEGFRTLAERYFDKYKALECVPYSGTGMALSLIHISEPTRPY